MDIQDLTKRALAIRDRYREANERNGHNQWQAKEYVQGLAGDVGDLSKLIMAKSGYRAAKDVEEKLAHELADCLWSIIVIADETKIDLERAFTKTMSELEQRLTT